MKHTDRGARDRSARSSLSAHESQAAQAREALYQELDRALDRGLTTAEHVTRRAMPLVWGALVCGALLSAVAVVRVTRRRPKASSALLKVDLKIQLFPERHPILAAIAAALVRQLFQELATRRARARELAAARNGAAGLIGASVPFASRVDRVALPLPVHDSAPASERRG